MTDNEQLTTDEKLLRLADMIDWLLFHPPGSKTFMLTGVDF